MKESFLNSNESLTMSDVVRFMNVLQRNIASSLNPLAAKVQNDPTNLTNISLKAGQINKINHTLGRKLLGYNVMLQGDLTSSPMAIIANNQKDNPAPQLTLWLITSADCVIDLEVY